MNHFTDTDRWRIRRMGIGLTLFFLFISVYVLWLSYAATNAQLEEQEQTKLRWNELLESESGIIIDDYTYIMPIDKNEITNLEFRNTEYSVIYDIWLKVDGQIIKKSYGDLRVNIFESENDKSYITRNVVLTYDGTEINDKETVDLYLNKDDIELVTGISNNSNDDT